MVARNAGHDGREANGTKSKSRHACTTKPKRRPPSASGEIRARYLRLIREKYRARGYSNVAINLMIRSWRQSTLNQYVVYAKLWFQFAMQGLQPTARNIVEFLTHMHNKGYNHDQICAARSGSHIS